VFFILILRCQLAELLGRYIIVEICQSLDILQYQFMVLIHGNIIYIAAYPGHGFKSEN